MRWCTAALLAVPLATLLVPAPSGYRPGVFHSLFFITTFIIVAYLTAAALFIRGLDGFTQELKHAYGLFVTGFCLIGIGYMQLTILPLIHQYDSWWVKYGFIGIPFFAGMACLYMGIRGYAKLFQVRSIFVSIWATAGITLAAGIASIFAPTATPNIPIDTITLHTAQLGQTVPLVVTAAAAVLCYQSRRRAGSAYIPALAWLYIFLLLDAIGCAAGIVIRLMQPGNNIILDSGLAYSLYVVSSIALIKSAIEFNKIRYGRDNSLPPDEQTFFGKPFDNAVSTDTVAGVITYLAGFASDATAIDPILDTMRIMTSTRDPGPFTEQEQRQLAKTYLQLEYYLSETDPVRRYSRDELQALLRTRFAAVLAENKAFAISTHTEIPNAS